MSNSPRKTTFQCLFGPIETEEEALKHVEDAAIYFYFSSVVNIVVYFFSSSSSNLDDGILIGSLALWLHLGRSRVAAVILLIYVILQIIFRIIIFINSGHIEFFTTILSIIIGAPIFIVILISLILVIKAAWRLQQTKPEVSIPQ